MKQYIYALIGVCLALSTQAQIELGTHFMSNVVQNNLTNPAAFTDNGYKVNVSLLPSIYTGFYNSSIAPDDVLEKQGNSLYLDVEGLIEKIGPDGMSFQTNLNIETFSFSFQATRRSRSSIRPSHHTSNHSHFAMFQQPSFVFANSHTDPRITLGGLQCHPVNFLTKCQK